MLLIFFYFHLLVAYQELAPFTNEEFYLKQLILYIPSTPVNIPLFEITDL